MKNAIATTFSLLVLLATNPAHARNGNGNTLPTSVALEKTVSLTLGCGTETAIEAAPGSTVYYCYKMSNTGQITVTNPSLVDDVIDDPLTNIGVSQCCDNSDGTGCSDESCQTAADCSDDTDFCVPATGTCCEFSFFGGGFRNCDPLDACSSDGECGLNHNCTGADLLLGLPGNQSQAQTMFTRVVTATVGSDSVVNTASFTAEPSGGRCCETDDPTACAGVTAQSPCTSDSSCPTAFPTCTFGTTPDPASAAATVYVTGDNCPDVASDDMTDSDGDGAGDICDNCRLTPNPRVCSESGGPCGNDLDCGGGDDVCAQPDIDGNGVGDACDQKMAPALSAPGLALMALVLACLGILALRRPRRERC